ncbi:MAG TPA: c-type cytochrome [Hyphomonadaceae bacterium]|nr:c-type cytochrome [Hyphomonadaceae bacterium]
MNCSIAASIAAAGAFSLVLAGCSSAPEPAYDGDPVVGLEVAQSLCASCHAIGREGASPNPGAPPLRNVLANYRADRLAQDLEKSVSISHLRMPTFYFGEHHAADVVAYLKTIQDPSPRN